MRPESPAVVDFYTRVHKSWWPLPQARDAVPLQRVQILQDRLVGFAPHRLLEIGFGDPRGVQQLQRRLPNSVFHVIELDPERVELAHTLGIPATTIDVSADPLPFPDGSFDAVVMAEVLEHLFDPDKAIGEVRRILAPTGSLFLSTPNLASWYNRVLLLCGLQPVSTEVSTVRVFGRRFARLGEGNPPVGHIRVFTLPALRGFLEFHGFVLKSIVGYGHPGVPMDRLFSRIPGIASGFVVEGAKAGPQSSSVPRQ